MSQPRTKKKKKTKPKKKTSHVEVVVRFRPPKKNSCNMYNWHVRGNEVQELRRDKKNSRTFRFNRIFEPVTTNEEMFDRVALPIVHDVLSGINGTIFAYGQTNSGKTHTIFGAPGTPGLIPRCVQTMFEECQEHKEDVFLFRVSYMEIYNEHLYDLLLEQKPTIALRQKENHFVPVDATEVIVTSWEEVEQVLALGNAHRSVGVSNLNEHSSRSHCVFRLTVESSPCVQPEVVRVSQLNLVDLAGSELLTYKFDAKQRKETKNINVSLTQLKTVIMGLSKKHKFVQYRNSVLTKMLKNALGGNARTLVVCTASSMPDHSRMTRSTFDFGSMAQRIENTPVVNEVGSETETLLRQYRERIQELENKVDEFNQLRSDKQALEVQVEDLQRKVEEMKMQENKADEEEIRELTSCMVSATMYTSVSGQVSSTSASQTTSDRMLYTSYGAQAGDSRLQSGSAGSQTFGSSIRSASLASQTSNPTPVSPSPSPHTTQPTMKRENEQLRQRRTQLQQYYQSAQANMQLRRQRNAVLQNCWKLSQMR